MKTRNFETPASSTGRYLNTGNGKSVQVIDILHPEYIAVIEPETAFWCLVKKEELADTLTGDEITRQLDKHYTAMQKEMDDLRFNLTPSAVYFNATDLCNLNCSYCYIPEPIRKDGKNMSFEQLSNSLSILKDYFKESITDDRKAQIVFHGSEPLMNKENIFKAIELFGNDFDFGIQTNGTLLEQEDFEFIKTHNVMLGLSIDGENAGVFDATRKNWDSKSVFNKVIETLEMCAGYHNLSVICTVTKENADSLVNMVDFLHEHGVEHCLLNQVRCTLEGGRQAKPADDVMAKMLIKALDRTYELYEKTGRKLVVVNFANILLSLLAPSARQLMCDISPCGGGRCFFAVSANGDVFPCSEFIGLPAFNSGNIFTNTLSEITSSKPFQMVTGRKVEDIDPCNRCAIRHFCGSPCPAEAYEINKAMNMPGAFCEFYEEQVRYALRLIADGKENAFLTDNWDSDTNEVFSFETLVKV